MTKKGHAIYKEGNYLGELEIFDQMEYCCSAIALTDGRLLRISRSDFLRWIEIDRNIQNVLMRNICSKFYTLSVKAAEDSFYSLKYRLCEFLLQCARQHDYMDSEQRLMINKAALSSYLAVTNRSVNRVVRELKDKGLVEIENGYISIKNMVVLAFAGRLRAGLLRFLTFGAFVLLGLGRLFVRLRTVLVDIPRVFPPVVIIEIVITHKKYPLCYLFIL